MSAEVLLDRLDKVQGGHDGQYSARCPAHQDRGPSLSIKDVGDGRILVHCHAGCETEDVLAAVGLSFRDVMPERVGANHRVERFVDVSRVLPILAHELAVALIILERSWGATREDCDRLAQVASRIERARKYHPDLRPSPELKAIRRAS